MLHKRNKRGCQATLRKQNSNAKRSKPLPGAQSTRKSTRIWAASIMATAGHFGLLPPARRLRAQFSAGGAERNLDDSRNKLPRE
jgi:hypothetical protein